MRRHKLLALALAFVLAFSACGGGETVGEQFEGFEEGEGGGTGRFELANTPTPAPAAETEGPQATEAPQETEAPALVVEITGEGYDPTKGRIFVNTVLEVRNTDDVPHTYTDSNLVFDSGEIQPGGVWRYTPTALGTHQINDKTRTWVIGSLEVIAG